MATITGSPTLFLSLKDRRSTPVLKWLMGWALFFASACDELGALPIPFGGQGTVPGSPIVGQAGELLGDELDFPQLEELSVISSQEVINAGLTSDQLSGVSVDSIILKVAEGSPGQNLDFLDRVQMQVRSEGNETTPVGVFENVPAGAQRIEVSVSGANIVDHATAESMSFDTLIRGTVPPADVIIDVDVLIGIKFNAESLLGG